jgi:hypothetical protein
MHLLILNPQEGRNIGFKVLTEVDMKISVLWDVTPCSLVEINQRFRGTFHVYLQG